MLHPAQMAPNMWIDPTPLQPLEEAHPNHLTWLTLSASNFITSPLQKDEKRVVKPMPQVEMSDVAGGELDCGYAEIVVSWMHFEIDKEEETASVTPTAQAVPVIPAAPMEVDAESVSSTGLAAAFTTQARVSEGRTLAAPASEGVVPSPPR